jgi:imidazolonepropionase-like amidohydrolase
MSGPAGILRAILLGVAALALLTATPAPAAELSLGPVQVVSVEDGSIRRDQVVLVRDGRIHAIRDHAGYAAGSGVTVLDGGGAYLVPGLAEMHAHVPSRERGEQYARDVLMLYLANGVTTVRGMLGEPWHLELRALLAAGAWEGPRLVTSGPSFNGRSVDSADQAAAMAKEQAQAGYDFLKLHPGLSAAEFAALADAAAALDIPFAGHVSHDVGLEAALARQQATIDHLDGYAQALLPPDSALAGVEAEWFGVNLAADMDPARLAALAAATANAGVWNVPTESLMENLAGPPTLEALLERPAMAYATEATRARWSDAVRTFRKTFGEAERMRFVEMRHRLIAELQRAGAGLLLGSDAPQIMNVPGFSVHAELANLVAAGLSPLQALQTGTLNVARFLGEADRGAIRVGYAADLLLLERNPLDDIGATAAPVGVMRGGRWYGRDALAQILAAVRDRGI